MKGAIVYNGFWNREGPSDPVQRLQKAAAERGIPLAALPNTALTAMFGPDGPAVLGLPEANFVLFWDKDVRLARTMEACGVRVYNAAEAVAVCDDKAATHLALAGGGIPMPRTLVAPIAAIDPEHPLDNECYEELTPLLRKLYAQQEENARQLATLKTQKDEQDALLAHMREGLVVLDGRQRIVTMNGAAQAILDAPAKLPEGVTLLEINRNTVLQEVLHALEQRDAAHAAMDACGRHYHVSASRIGKGEGALLLLLDDTADYEAEAARRQFTANVSHELRTPLTTISGYAELLENHLVASPEDTEKFLSRIRKEAGRMLTLVEDILRLSQLDEGSLELKPQEVDLKQLAQETITSLQPKAEQREVTLSVTGDAPTVTTDPALLGEILYNLLDNAIKYNRAGGKAEILLDEVGGHARIRVRDTGIGIPKEHQQKVFERFYRVDKSRSKATGGTGLGLSIVKHAVQLLGGELRLESNPGQGTTMTVLL